MAAINIEAEWKEALELLQSTVEEWEKSTNDRYKLNAGELEVIQETLEDIQRFVAIHCPNFACLLEFYEKFERLAIMFGLASIKMRQR